MHYPVSSKLFVKSACSKRTALFKAHHGASSIFAHAFQLPNSPQTPLRRKTTANDRDHLELHSCGEYSTRRRTDRAARM
jgi:hypothetical protein